MKAILSLKNGEITLEKLVSRFEELLSRYPDLLEEAYIYTDPKKVKKKLPMLSSKRTFAVWLNQANVVVVHLQTALSISAVSSEHWVRNFETCDKLNTMPEALQRGIPTHYFARQKIV